MGWKGTRGVLVAFCVLFIPYISISFSTMENLSFTLYFFSFMSIPISGLLCSSIFPKASRNCSARNQNSSSYSISV